MTKAATVDGHDPVRPGAGCDVNTMGFDRCMRGAVVTGQSVMRKAIDLVDISMDAYFDIALAYNVSITLLGAFPYTYQCLPTTKLARLITRPGIWSHIPAHNRSYSPNVSLATEQRFADQVVPGASGDGSYTFFMQAIAQPGQAEESDPKGQDSDGCFDKHVDPMDCCQTSSFAAWSC